MDEKSKAPQGRTMGLKAKGADGRDQREHHQYNSSEELKQDAGRFSREYGHYRSVTPEPRVCVYRIASSVPFTNAAALRKTRRWI